jgi:hypothetical protein
MAMLYINYKYIMFLSKSFEAIATAGAAPSFQPRELQKNEAKRLKRLGRAQNRTPARAPPPVPRREAGRLAQRLRSANALARKSPPCRRPSASIPWPIPGERCH